MNKREPESSAVRLGVTHTPLETQQPRQWGTPGNSPRFSSRSAPAPCPSTGLEQKQQIHESDIWIMAAAGDADRDKAEGLRDICAGDTVAGGLQVWLG